MLRKLRSRLTYANVVSTIALALAVGGGTAYAATKIGTQQHPLSRRHRVEGGDERGHRLEGQEQRALGRGHPRQLARAARTCATARSQAVDFAAGQLPKGDKGDPATSIFGVVNALGGLTSQKSLTAISGTGPTYTITTNQDVSKCAAVTTLVGGAAGSVTAEPTAGNAQQITFQTFGQDGTRTRARSSSPSTVSRLTGAGRVECVEHPRLAPRRSSWPADDERAGADALAVSPLRPRPEAGPDVPVVNAVDEPDPAAVVSPRLAQLQLRAVRPRAQDLAAAPEHLDVVVARAAHGRPASGAAA